ncbi:MAG: hypothetical protein AAF682_03810 [Planctomycetota bacterium]
MRRLPHVPASRRSGFTLLEVTMSAVLFTIMTYGLTSAMQLSFGSRNAVEAVASESRTLRSTARALTAEMKLASDSRISLETLDDGNNQLTFQLPVVVGGNLGWGVPGSQIEAAGAGDEESWKLRYTVDAVADNGADGINRRLLRQVLDGDDLAIEEEVVAENLRSGNGVDPGFRVAKTGDVWEIKITKTSNLGRQAVLHVSTRN